MASFSDAGLDAATARALQRGDRAAQAAVYEALAPTVMAMAQRVLQDRGLAQEVVQDTFVELIERGHTLRTPEAVIGWLRKVAFNHCLMRVRSPWHKRRVERQVEEREDGMSAGERLEGMEDIERALAALGPETRMVVWMHDVEGYTHKEIGSLLGRTASFSKSQLARGYEKLLGRFGGTHERHDTKPDDSTVRPACSS